MTTLIGDWWQLRQVARAAASQADRSADQHLVIDAFNRRVAEIRREVASWREIHARMWEPFGPEVPLRAPGTGVGGAAISPPPVMALVSSDELSGLAENVQQTGESLRALDRVIARAARVLASLPAVWPVRGSVNSEFGTRVSPWSRDQEFHAGIDIAAERGTPVRAPATGIVALAGPNAEYGLSVILDHGQEIRTVYGHLSKIGVKVGQKVERGAEIGLTGSTGRSSGPHLHYEILVQGQPVNPRVYLWD